MEIGLLIDTYDRLGLDAIAQVNLGIRAHRNRPLTELGPMEPAGDRHAAEPLRRFRTPGWAYWFATDGDDHPHRTHDERVAGGPAADEHIALDGPGGQDPVGPSGQG